MKATGTPIPYIAIFPPDPLNSLGLRNPLPSRPATSLPPWGITDKRREKMAAPHPHTAPPPARHTHQQRNQKSPAGENEERERGLSSIILQPKSFPEGGRQGGPLYGECELRFRFVRLLRGRGCVAPVVGSASRRPRNLKKLQAPFFPSSSASKNSANSSSVISSLEMLRTPRHNSRRDV